jgi:hypothetical protein
MTQRYVVRMTPDMRGWGILDREWYGYCTLMDENQNLLPLEWGMEEGAEAWLNMCYRAWESGRVPAPDNWRPLPDIYE